MSIYRDAAELVIKRQFGIYGVEEIISLCQASGWEIDNSGNVLSVNDEKRAFAQLCTTLSTKLGPIAALGSKLALMNYFAQGKEESRAEVKNIMRPGKTIRDVNSDYVFLTDLDLKVIEADGNFLGKGMKEDTLIIGKTLCQIFELTSPGACPASECVNCPVKKSIRTMATVEVEMVVNSKAQQWRSVPIINTDSIPDRALVHIKNLTSSD